MPENLDDATTEDLMLLCENTNAPAWKRQYAAFRLSASFCRVAGAIQTALEIEDKMEAIYTMLPKAERW